MGELDYEATNSVVSGVVEQAVASLQAIGLTEQGALSMLLTQAAVRMDDAEALHRVLNHISGGFIPPGA
jgi:hypothetical protein